MLKYSLKRAYNKFNKQQQELIFSKVKELTYDKVYYELAYQLEVEKHFIDYANRKIERCEWTSWDAMLTFSFCKKIVYKHRKFTNKTFELIYQNILDFIKKHDIDVNKYKDLFEMAKKLKIIMIMNKVSVTRRVQSI